MAERLLEVTGIETCYGLSQVLFGISLAISAGEMVTLMGRNGMGKTTLIRTLMGLVRPRAGCVLIDGRDATRDPTFEIARAGIAYVPEGRGIFASLTVAENLDFWARYLDGGAPIATALDAVGLGGIASLPAAYLSAGQRRRLSIARLIAVERPLWLLDEPTSALDAAAQAMLAGLMRDHLAGGGMILAATHGPIGLDGAKELRLGGAG